MSTFTFKEPLRGIVPPLATPLRGPDTLDTAGQEKLIEHVLHGGVHGIFLLGTTGEGTSLSRRTRREVTTHATDVVRGRVPVLVAVSHAAFRETVHLATHAADCGADALVVAPPHPLPADGVELNAYLDRLTGEVPLPVFLYHMPPLSRLPFDPQVVARAMENPGIVGLKDSSFDMLYFHQVQSLLSRRPDWTLMVGPEELLGEALLMGAHGGVSGGANLFPQLYVALFQAAQSGDLERLRTLHRIVRIVADGIYRVTSHPTSVIKGIKCALEVLEIGSNTLAEPLRPFADTERERIARCVQQVLDTRPW